MSDKTVSVGLRIDGDASGAVKAVAAIESSMAKSSAQAGALDTELGKVQAQILAMGAAAKDLPGVKAAADSVEQLANGAVKATAGTASLVAEERRLALEAANVANAGRAIDAAFKTLGIKSLKDVRAETERLQAALATIKATGIVGPDQERAVAALKFKLAELRTEAAAIPGSAASAKTAIAGIGSEARASESALGGMAGKAAAAVAALASFSAVTHLAGDIIKTGAAFETLETRLTSLLGSAESAQEAMGQIKQLAITTPFEVSALAESFVKLTAFGLQPSMEQMQALADTAATLGGGTESLSGITLALGQAWAKGKLQGEEILQMAERGVPVWDVLAQATGKNATELQKMSEAGELGRGTILKLVDALGKMNAGASEKMMATFSGAVSNAKDALAEFYDMVAKAGVLDFLTKQAQDLLAEFSRMKETGELDAAAKRMADAFVAAGEGIRSAIEAINALSGVIKFSAEVFVAWRLSALTLIPALSGVGAAATATAVQTTAMSVATERATIATRGLAVATRLLKGLTLVGLVEGAISLGTEFLRAKKAAEDGDRAVKKMLEPVAVNGPRDAIKAVVTETEAARFSLTEYQRAMIEMQAQGKATGDVLAAMVNKSDLGSVKGIAEMLSGLESVRKGAQATGAEIQTAIRDRLNKMSAGDLHDFGIMAQSAFDQGRISAGDLAATLNGSVDAALKQLGSSAEVSAGGMTARFIESSTAIGVVNDNFQRLKDSGQDAAAVLKEAFAGGLNTAKSVQDLEGLAVSIRQAGEQGNLSKKDVADFLDTISTKVDAIKPGIDSLAEAFKTLGMAAPEDLKKTAGAAEEAYNKIKAGSDFSRAGLANVKEAFKRMAEASIAANGGVASDTLRVKAEMMGFEVVVDSTGKTMLRTAEAADDLAGKVSAGGDSAKKAAGEYDDLADSISGAAEAGDGLSSVGVRGPSGSRGGGSSQADFTETLYRRGGSIEETRLAQKYVGELYARNQATMLTGNLGSDANAARLMKMAVNDAVDKALEAAREEIKTGKAVDLGTSVADIQARNLSRTPLTGIDDIIKRIKYAGTEAKGQVHRIELVSGNQRSNLSGSDDDVKNLLDILGTHKLRAS